MADAAFMEHVYRRFLAFFQETMPRPGPTPC